MPEKTLAKPRLSAAERRASILDAALALFSERGFRGTTTRELAAAVGVTEPVLYEHFRTKGELYAAIIDHKSKAALERISELRDAYLDRDDDHGLFTLLANLLLDVYDKDPAFVRLMLYSALENHEMKEIAYERQNSVFFGIIAGYVERRIAAGKLRPMNPLLAAHSFIGMVAHYGTTQVLFPCCAWPADRAKVVQEMVTMFLDGLCRRDGE